MRAGDGPAARIALLGCNIKGGKMSAISGFLAETVSFRHAFTGGRCFSGISRILGKLLSRTKKVNNSFFALVVALIRRQRINILVSSIIFEDRMSITLSKEQDLVRRFLASAEEPRSFREIAAYLGPGYYAATARRIVGRLERRGLVSRTPKMPRFIRVLALPESVAA
jgi:hypothetical protein